MPTPTDDEQQTRWRFAHDVAGAFIRHDGLLDADADRIITLYVSNALYSDQVDRLIEWLNHIAPHGIVLAHPDEDGIT